MIQQATRSPTQLLLDEFRQGSEDAAREIFNQYHFRLLKVAASRISTSLQSRFDAEDIVQSAFLEFFQKVKEGKIRVTTCQELWSVLATFTVNKTRSYIEKEFAAKRIPYKERQNVFSGLTNHGEVSPVAASILKESLQLLMANMTPRDRRIIELHLRGATTKDIVVQFADCRAISAVTVPVDVSPATVRRVLRESRKCLREQLVKE